MVAIVFRYYFVVFTVPINTGAPVSLSMIANAYGLSRFTYKTGAGAENG